MSNLLIFGVGAFAEVAAYYFESESDFRVSAFVVDDDYWSSNHFQGRPVLRSSELTSQPSCDAYFFVAIGWAQSNALRSKKVEFLRSLGFSPASFVSKHAYVAQNAVVGEHCFILEHNVVQPFVKVGDNVVLWSGNHVGHHAEIQSHCFVSSHVVIGGNAIVGESCFLGINSTICDGVVVGPRCFIGASVTVAGDTEAGALIVPSGRPRLISGGAALV